MINLDSKTTALVLIDLQKGIVSRPLAPRDGNSLVAAGKKLAEMFRKAGATVVLVNVGWAKDWGDALRQPVDKPMQSSPNGLPADFSTLADGLAQPNDILVTKHQWGAFYGTDLDVQLRRRGVKAIVLGGVATNIGVESTARQAWEAGYEVVIAEDATTSMSPEMHTFAVSVILPLISRVTQVANLSLHNDG
jgi:nicotinamidase-related amidase